MDEDKKRKLLRNLARVPNITHLLQTCEDRPFCDFKETCNYLCNNSMVMDKVNSSIPSTYAMLNTTIGKPEEPDLEDMMNRVHLMIQEKSPVQVYQALRSPTMRESFNIPTLLWKELEPTLKERIIEIRDAIRKRKENIPKEPERKDKSRQNSLPPQYANKTSMDYVANLCSLMTIHEDDEDTDDDMMYVGFCTTALGCRAHLEYANSCSSLDKMYAISDGGADACVVGANAYIASETGRCAHLIGYNPVITKSSRIPIVTAYLKVTASGGIPVLLQRNEAVFNAGSPVTLLSEYQNRDYGYIVGYVARKYRTCYNTYGIQRIILNDTIDTPFVDRGGLMDFEFPPIEDNDIDVENSKYDIFELVSSQKWMPSRFCADVNRSF